MTENEVFEGIHKDCGSLEICDYKNTGCSDCIIRQTLIKAEEALEEIQTYRAIGTVEECREAVERMKPKKMLNSGERIPFSWYCPNCREELTDDGYKYDDECCYHCGQAIDKS